MESSGGPYERSAARFYIDSTGKIGIGTTNPTHKLSVNGTIKAKEVIVETTGWSDYVFADDYTLATLAEVEAHIKEHKHLPGISSAEQVSEQGISVGDMQAKLLAKIEELTLHVIRIEKKRIPHCAVKFGLSAKPPPDSESGCGGLNQRGGRHPAALARNKFGSCPLTSA